MLNKKFEKRPDDYRGAFFCLDEDQYRVKLEPCILPSKLVHCMNKNSTGCENFDQVSTRFMHIHHVSYHKSIGHILFGKPIRYSIDINLTL